MLLCGKEPILERVSKPKIAVIKFIFSQKDVEVLNKIEEKNTEAISKQEHIQPKYQIFEEI